MPVTPPTATYTTREAFKKRLPQTSIAELLAESSDSSTVLDAMLDSILFEAQGTIDSRLRAMGYAIPVVETPAADGTPTADMVLLESHTLSIAKFLALSRRGMSNYDPAAQRLYDAAQDWLKRPVLAGAAVAAPPSPTSTKRLGSGSDTRIFGEDADGVSHLKGL